VVESLKFAVGILILSVIVLEMKIFPDLALTLPFPVSVVVAIRLGGSFFELAVVQNPKFAYEISMVSVILPQIDTRISGSGGNIAIPGCRSCRTRRWTLVPCSPISPWSTTP